MRLRSALDGLDLAIATRLNRAAAALLADQEARRVRLRAVVPAEEADEWQRLAELWGDERTYAAAAMGLTVAPLPDAAWRLLRPEEWRR